jgi:hypothetical protein
MTSNGVTLVIEIEHEGQNTIRDLLKQEKPDYLNDCSLQAIVKDEILDEITSVFHKTEKIEPKNEQLEHKLETSVPGNDAQGNGAVKEDLVIKEEADADESTDDEEEEESSAESEEGDEVNNTRQSPVLKYSLNQSFNQMASFSDTI